jgi:adenylate kinase
MMGRPGSGKGTQGMLLAKKLGAEIYSSGNRLREMAKGEGFVAGKIRSVVNEGDLLPAWFSSHLFVEALLSLSPKDGIVFEGACRRLEEAEAFDETTTWLERPYRAIFLDISDEEVEKRLAIRRGVAGRADDASDTVEHRLHEYATNTVPALEFLRAKGMVIDIASDGTIEEVHAKVLAALNLE